MVFVPFGIRSAKIRSTRRRPPPRRPPPPPPPPLPSLLLSRLSPSSVPLPGAHEVVHRPRPQPRVLLQELLKVPTLPPTRRGLFNAAPIRANLRVVRLLEQHEHVPMMPARRRRAVVRHEQPGDARQVLLVRVLALMSVEGRGSKASKPSVETERRNRASKPRDDGRREEKRIARGRGKKVLDGNRRARGRA